MTCEQEKQAPKFSRREFLKLGAKVGATVLADSAAKTIAANELVRALAGPDLFGDLLAWWRRDAPYMPFHPGLMWHYFESAKRIPGFLELENVISGKIVNERPQSVQQLLEIGLESANSQGFGGIDCLRMGLLSVAALGQVNPDNVAIYFPPFIPEGAREGYLIIGQDKSIHLTSALHFALELLLASCSGDLRWERRANEFRTGGWLAINVFGQQRLSQIKTELMNNNKGNFPFCPEIFDIDESGKIQELKGIEKKVAELLTDLGIVFEAYTTPHDQADCYLDDLREQQALWIAEQRAKDLLSLIISNQSFGGEEEIDRLIGNALNHPSEAFICGLGDIGAKRDFAANQAGIATAISLFRQAKAGIFEKIPTIPLDDYCQTVGFWSGELNEKGEVIGEPPPPYPLVSRYTMAVAPDGTIVARVIFDQSQNFPAQERLSSYPPAFAIGNNLDLPLLIGSQ